LVLIYPYQQARKLFIIFSGQLLYQLKKFYKTSSNSQHNERQHTPWGSIESFIQITAYKIAASYGACRCKTKASNYPQNTIYFIFVFIERQKLLPYLKMKIPIQLN